jgi:hypothetical protein
MVLASPEIADDMDAASPPEHLDVPSSTGTAVEEPWFMHRKVQYVLSLIPLFDTFKARGGHRIVPQHLSPSICG